MDALNKLEAAVLDKLLAGEEPELACLREQRRRLHVTKREYTGVGFFTEFGHPADAVQLPTSKSIRFGDVLAEMEGLKHGAGFLLYIDNGMITMLEGYSHASESWPDKGGAFEVRYWEPKRDLSVFRV